MLNRSPRLLRSPCFPEQIAEIVPGIDKQRIRSESTAIVGLGQRVFPQSTAGHPASDQQIAVIWCHGEASIVEADSDIRASLIVECDPAQMRLRNAVGMGEFENPLVLLSGSLPIPLLLEQPCQVQARRNVVHRRRQNRLKLILCLAQPALFPVQAAEIIADSGMREPEGKGVEISRLFQPAALRQGIRESQVRFDH